MCCLLGSMVACLLVPCTSGEHSRDMVHYNCLDSLTAGLKQTTAFCMIVHLMICTRGLWAGSVALPRSLSWLTGVLSTLPITPWLGPGASDRAQHLALQVPTSHQAKQWSWSTSCLSGTGKGRNSCICFRMHCTSLSKPDVMITTAQAATLSSSKSALLPPVDHVNAF
jgi:hypothetical protein